MNVVPDAPELVVNESAVDTLVISVAFAVTGIFELSVIFIIPLIGGLLVYIVEDELLVKV